jgi:hypothetical protein
MKNEQKSTLIYGIIGIIIGYVSYLIRNNLLSLVLAIIVLYGMSEVLKRALKINEKFKWFWTYGGWIYLFVWFIVWTIFFNL